MHIRSSLSKSGHSSFASTAGQSPPRKFAYLEVEQINGRDLRVQVLLVRGKLRDDVVARVVFGHLERLKNRSAMIAQNTHRIRYDLSLLGWSGKITRKWRALM